MGMGVMHARVLGACVCVHLHGRLLYMHASWMVNSHCGIKSSHSKSRLESHCFIWWQCIEQEETYIVVHHSFFTMLSS